MTERSRRQVRRTASEFVIGPSHVRWDGGTLHFEIDERGSPLPRRVRGRVRLHPAALCRFVTALDASGRHRWGPIAPVGRVEVAFDEPALRWQGAAYFDSNEGDEPMHLPFRTWDWARGTLRDGGTAVIYDVRARDGGERVIAQRFARDGGSTAFEAPARHGLPRSAWGIQRAMRSESPPRVTETLEDTPFYVRSTLAAQLLGEPLTLVHESLNLPRVASLPVRLMLPFRMPRRP